MHKVNKFQYKYFQVFEVASSDLITMGITVVSYTLKDIRDEEVCILSLLLVLHKIIFNKRGKPTS